MKKKIFALIPLLSVFLSSLAVADRFEKMASPVSNPVNFEDPRALTELRAVYLYHKIDSDFVTTGGDVRIYALQARFAIDDRFSIIATKDGYVDLNSDLDAIPDADGFGNLALGAKYAFIRDEDSGLIASFGTTVEVPTGDNEVFQGDGDGFIRPFLTAGLALEHVNIITATGLRTPFSGEDDFLWDYDFHIDVPFSDRVYPGFDINVIHAIDGGKRLPIADFGADYFNFGAADSEGETMVTAAVTNRIKITDAAAWGLAYQFPLSSGAGSQVFDWRITTDLQISF